MNIMILVAIIIQYAIAKSSRVAGAIAGYIITTGILLWGLSAYGNGNYISLFGVRLSQAVFFLVCLVWYGIDTYQFRQAKQEEAAAREDFEARYERKKLVTAQKQNASEPAVAGIGSEEIKTALDAHPDLTGEERKVLELILSGRQNLEIADELRTSPIHASLLQSQLREKFRAETNEDLIKLMLQQG